MKQNTLEHDTRMTQPGNFLTGLLIGGLAGAATMLLFAPQSGKDTRRQIQQKAMELREQTMTTAEEKMEQVRGRASQIKDDVRDRAKQLKEQGQDVLVEQLDRVSEAAEKGKRVVQGGRQGTNNT